MDAQSISSGETFEERRSTVYYVSEMNDNDQCACLYSGWLLPDLAAHYPLSRLRSIKRKDKTHLILPLSKIPLHTHHCAPTTAMHELSVNLTRKFLNPRYSDLHVRCGDKSFLLHRAVVASSSEVMAMELDDAVIVRACIPSFYHNANNTLTGGHHSSDQTHPL